MSAKSIEKAEKISKLFYGMRPRNMRKTRITWPRALVLLGKCAQLNYVCDKFDGKVREYYHRFGPGCMVFAGDSPQADGTQLLIIKGKFKIQKAGITG